MSDLGPYPRPPTQSHNRRSLALLAKPATIVIPFMALVIDTLVLQRTWRSSLRRLWPWFVLVIPCMIWTKLSQPTPEIAAPPLWQRPIIALNAIGFYVRKLRWPAELGIDYGLTPEVLVRKWYWVATAGVVVIVAVSRTRWAIAALAIFVLGLLPVEASPTGAPRSSSAPSVVCSPARWAAVTSGNSSPSASW